MINFIKYIILKIKYINNVEYCKEDDCGYWKNGEEKCVYYRKIFNKNYCIIPYLLRKSKKINKCPKKRCIHWYAYDESEEKCHKTRIINEYSRGFECEDEEFFLCKLDERFENLCELKG